MASSPRSAACRSLPRRSVRLAATGPRLQSSSKSSLSCAPLTASIWPKPIAIFFGGLVVSHASAASNHWPRESLLRVRNASSHQFVMRDAVTRLRAALKAVFCDQPKLAMPGSVPLLIHERNLSPRTLALDEARLLSHTSFGGKKLVEAVLQLGN